MRNHYMTLGNNEVVITYSNVYTNNNIKCINVCIEKATDNDLLNVVIQMPFCKILDCYGMNNNDISYWLNFVKKNYSLIQELALRKEDNFIGE